MISAVCERSGGAYDTGEEPGFELLACGHYARHVSEGRCWGCHLDHLREIGEEARADRLVVLRRQQDEGRLHWGRLVDDLRRSYEARLIDGTDHCAPDPTRLVRAVERDTAEGESALAALLAAE